MKQASVTPEPRTVLCIETHAATRAALAALLQPAGFRVLGAASLAQAMALLQHETIAVVLCDLHLPELDGVRVLAHLRTHAPHVLRVLLIAYVDLDRALAALERGEIHRYVSKPWDEQVLVATLRELCARFALEAENRRLQALVQAQNDALAGLNTQLGELNRTLDERVQARARELGEAHASLRTAHERLKTQFVVSIRLFSNLLELRNGALAGHSRRVADLARRIGMRMGLDVAQVNDLVMAGLLHDLGKMAWPDELLSTPLNQMSAEQLIWVRKHPAMGQAALMALESMALPGKLIRAHHERFDGTGYPDQLSGLNIPLGARILAVANDYDGLQIGTHNTVRLSPEQACAAIEQGSGRRYDPQVVNVLLDLLGGERRAVVTRDVVLKTTQLKPGMTLARDLVSSGGVLLLAADYELDESLIHQLRELEALENTRLKLQIRGDSIGPLA